MKKVLFVCIGNACRSPMAEAFARLYGSDVMEASSAGLYPARAVPEETITVMREKNVDMSRHVPRPFEDVKLANVDRIINLSGLALDGGNVEVHDWPVPDPIGHPIEFHRKIRDLVEHNVMRLILAMRAGKA